MRSHLVDHIAPQMPGTLVIFVLLDQCTMYNVENFSLLISRSSTRRAFGYAQNPSYMFPLNWPLVGTLTCWVCNMLATSHCNGIWEMTSRNRHNVQLLETETSPLLVLGCGTVCQQTLLRVSHFHCSVENYLDTLIALFCFSFFLL